MDATNSINIENKVLNDFVTAISPIFDIDKIIQVANQSLEALSQSVGDLKFERLKNIGMIVLISLSYLVGIVALVAFVAGVVLFAMTANPLFLIPFVVGEFLAEIFLALAIIGTILAPKNYERIKSLEQEIDTYPIEDIQQRIAEIEAFKEVAAEPDSLLHVSPGRRIELEALKGDEARPDFLLHMPPELNDLIGFYIVTNVKMEENHNE